MGGNDWSKSIMDNGVSVYSVSVISARQYVSYAIAKIFLENWSAQIWQELQVNPSFSIPSAQTPTAEMCQ